MIRSLADFFVSILIKNAVCAFASRGTDGAGCKQSVKIGRSGFQQLIGVFMRFSDVYQIAGFLYGAENVSSDVVKSQNPHIRCRGLQNLLCNAEECTHNHSVNAGSGVALGFGGGNDIIQGVFLP